MPVDDLPEPIRGLFTQPTPSSDQMHALVVRLNYLKFKAARLRESLDHREPRVVDLDQIEFCLKGAKEVRNRLFNGLLPTLLAVARQHLVAQEDRSPGELLRLLGIGQQALAGAIDSYDPVRAGSFESYVSWSLRRRFASLAAVEMANKQSQGSEGGTGVGPASRPPAPPAARARRREEPTAVVHRLVDLAGESGVDLKLDPEPEPPKM